MQIRFIQGKTKGGGEKKGDYSTCIQLYPPSLPPSIMIWWLRCLSNSITTRRKTWPTHSVDGKHLSAFAPYLMGTITHSAASSLTSDERHSLRIWPHNQVCVMCQICLLLTESDRCRVPLHSRATVGVWWKEKFIRKHMKYKENYFFSLFSCRFECFDKNKSQRIIQSIHSHFLCRIVLTSWKRALM